MSSPRQKLKIATPAPSRSSGSIQGMGESIATDELTGALSLGITLSLPQARGSRPALELRYRSGAGNGPFGIGFAIGPASVARATARGAPRYRLDDVFTHSEFGELVYLAGCDRQQQRGAEAYTVRCYRPRHETGFPSVQWWIGETDSYWLVVDRDNVTSVFGPDPSARVADPADPGRVFEWLLVETFDAHGNHALYEYQPEDGAGLPATASRAARYLARVRWGNAAPAAGSLVLELTGAQLAQLGWHFQAILDYGQYAEDASPVDRPVGSWAVRADPFSTYRAGFAIAGYRLCRGILTTHGFPDELGPDPVLVGSVRLRYDATPFGSTLARVEKVGFRTDPDGRRRSRALAPLELTWSQFDEADGRWWELDFGPQGRPEPAAEDDLRWVDLDGTGIAGLLHAGADGIRYWAPQTVDPVAGTVRYSAPRLVRAAPTGAASDSGVFTLVDVLGSGRPQWVDTTPGSAGYAELRPDGSPGPLRTFQSFPSDWASPAAAQVNVTGTGLADLVLIDDTGVRWNACLAAVGYGPRQQVPGGGLPPATGDQPGEARRFADVLGSGEQHWVRVRNGSVTCWPNLGFGRLGEPVELAGAPFLAPDFEPDRLYLLDLDGSGAADLAYHYLGHVRIWRNQSGQGFAAPFDIPLPPGADAVARVAFADVLGSGTSCLVVSQPYPTVRHWAYVFGRGQKPCLLTGIDNGTGQLTSVDYTTSAQQYLADQARRPDVPSALPVVPFPVHVVARIQQDDLLSGGSSVQTFRYRHGYYDPDECTFNGFGFVERQDAESVPAGDGPPPLVTRSWYHTGAGPAAGPLESLYRAEYSDCDPSRYPLRGCLLKVSAGGEATRQALVSLTGRLLHLELYGLDGSDGQQLPYRVEEFRYQSDQLEPHVGTGPVPFHTRLLESVSYDYERDPADPRVWHTFVLAVDDYGNVTDRCQLSYPRRAGGPARTGQEIPQAQNRLLAHRGRHAYLNVTEQFRLLGVPSEDLEQSLTGLVIPESGYLDLAGLTAQLAGSAVTGTPTQWARYDYQPDSGTAPLAAQRLLLSVSYAEHQQSLLEQAYIGALTPAELSTVLSGAGPTGCGLHAGSEIGASGIPGAPDPAQWWWNPGDRLGYAGSDGFYRPRTSADPFGDTVTTTDDPYCLFVSGVTDQLGNRTVASADYQALDYCRITDPNGSVVETGFDPLGIAEVTSRYGSEGGTAVGFAPLADWQQPPVQPGIAEMLSAPASYLQQAATAFGYDPLAFTGVLPADALDSLGVDADALWAELVDRGYLTREGAACQRFRSAYRQGGITLSAPFASVAGEVAALLAAVPAGAPVGGVLLSASEYPGGGTGTNPATILAQLCYYDGNQRVLQTKASTGSSEPARRWLASGTVRYDAKGQLSRQFEPYFTATPSYDETEVAEKLGVSSVLHYDALGRLVRTDTPLGTFRATVYGPDRSAAGSPWTVAAYDENDTLPQSKYYADLMSVVAPDPWQKQVVEQAALCADSPVRSFLDPLGRVIRTVSQDAAVVTTADLRPLGLDAEQLLAALTTAGYLDDRSRFTAAFTGWRTGWTVTLPPPFDAHAAAITGLLSGLQRHGTPLPTDFELDPQGNQARVSDARLGESGVANLQSLWSLAGADVYTLSADGGPHWRLRNAAGNVVWERDGTGTVTVTGYDALQRTASQRIARADGSSYTCLLAIYGDSLDAGRPYFADPARWNLRGQLVATLDTAGLTLSPFRSIQGLAYAQRRTLRADPATVPDWSQLPATAATELCTTLAALTGPEQLADLVPPAALAAMLEPAGYLEQSGYDALGRLVRAVDADRNVLQSTLDDRGLVTGVLLTPAAPATAPMTLGPVAYDAHDRPVSLTVAGVFATDYLYSPETFHLVGIRTVSLAEPAPADPVRQALTYYRDPVGNVGIVLDAAAVAGPAPQQPAASYRYDPLYRLVAATGREAGGGGPVPYREQYLHDAGGNVVHIGHTGASDWERTYQIAPDSNRLATGVGYDDNGNVTSFTGASTMAWTDHHQLASFSTPPGPDGSVLRELNIYGADGRRWRRISHTYPSSSASTPTATEQVSDIGLIEMVRRTDPDGSYREWHSTAITVGPVRLGRWITWTANGHEPLPAPTIRFPLVDVIGSVTCELDVTGELVTYHQYLPFGGDALAWSATAADDELLLRRYSGRELDSAGLYHYGARHYSPTLMRWASPDPAGTADSLNLYQFVGGNPVTFTDAGGRMKIYHWNVKDKTPTTIAANGFVNELSALLSGASVRDNHGTAVFLTEIMASVTGADFQALVAALNRKSGPGWSGQAFAAGSSSGGSRKEKIGILTYNVTVENYWQLVQDSSTSRKYVMERQAPGTAFAKRHSYASRYPVGVRLQTQLGGSTTSLDIGGYHNQGPGSGADTQASAVINAAIANDVHVLIGDFNTEPPAKRLKTGPTTRRSSLRDAVTESNMATSRGGSLYDRAVVTNDQVGGRQLKARNETGARGRSSDHASNSTVLTTRKRSRED